MSVEPSETPWSEVSAAHTKHYATKLILYLAVKRGLKLTVDQDIDVLFSFLDLGPHLWISAYAISSILPSAPMTR